MRHLSWLLLLAVIVCVAGCSDETPTGPPIVPEVPVFKPPTSPENLLYNLKMAYQERDVDELAAVLADDFLFFFSEDDLQRFPDPYTRADEQVIHGAMFDPGWVRDLELDFHVGELTVDLGKTTAGDTTWAAYLDQVELYLYGANPQHPNEDPQGWRLQDGISRFWFKKTQGVDPGTGDPIWEITEWREIDNKDGGLRSPTIMAAESSTWGEIKSLFHTSTAGDGT